MDLGPFKIYRFFYSGLWSIALPLILDLRPFKIPDPFLMKFEANSFKIPNPFLMKFEANSEYIFGSKNV